MSSIQRVEYILNKDWDVEEMKRVIEENEKLSLENKLPYKVWYGAQDDAIEFVCRHINRFGIEFLEEMLTWYYFKALNVISLRNCVYFCPSEHLLDVTNILVRYTHPHIVADVIEWKAKWVPLGCPISKKHLPVLLSAYNKWHHSDGEIPRNLLRYIGNPEVAKLLSEQYGVSNEYDPFVMFGKAPIEMMELFCQEWGWDINARLGPENGGVTPLINRLISFEIHGKWDKQCIERMLLLGADPNLRDSIGRTAKTMYGADNWKRDFGLVPIRTADGMVLETPFMGTLGGVSWRFAPAGHWKLQGQTLTLAGLEERTFDFTYHDGAIFVQTESGEEKVTP